MMRTLNWIFALALLLVGVCARAQASMTIEPAGDPTLQCLDTSKARPLAYTDDMRARRETGTVRVRLTFTAPDAAPDVEVFYTSTSSAEIEALVRRYVRDYRLPCLPEQRRVTVTQDFRFDPFDGRPVYYGKVNEEAQARTSVPPCLERADPARQLSFRRPGAVIVEMKFAEPGQAPQARVLYSSDSRLDRQVLDHVATYRLPCADDAFRQATVRQKFHFLRERGSFSQLKELTLDALVRAAGNAEARPVYFDTRTMGCPFELAFTPYQPHAANSVGEVGGVDPNRRDLVEWIKGLTFAWPKNAEADVLGAETRISVPCMVVDLGRGP